jgi:hypothetical protein
MFLSVISTIEIEGKRTMAFDKACDPAFANFGGISDRPKYYPKIWYLPAVRYMEL